MFQLFPKIDYKVNDYDTIRGVDITVSAKLKRYLKTYRALALRPYIVKDGELPEVISTKIYGSPKYSYVLLIINEVHSLFDDWPKNSITFKKYLIEKYGSIVYTQNTTHSWYTGNDNVVSEEYWSTLSDDKKYFRSIFEYETELNDKKAEINIMDFKFVIDFETKLQELLVSN